MNHIPFRAFKFGAERLSEVPISFDKSRVSGSIKMSYILPKQAGCMPGQCNIFILNHLNTPNLDTALLKNRYIQSFKQNKSYKKGSKDNCLDLYDDNFTYDKYSAFDDETLKSIIESCYRQVFGNLQPMSSEIDIEPQRRLRNGDINIKEYIRSLVHSDFYRKHYFNNVSPKRLVELSYKHILGRPPLNQVEISNEIEFLHDNGYENYLDKLIDSDEYFNAFGSNYVPFQRCWNSPRGFTTLSFVNSSILNRSFASSDNAKYSPCKTFPSSPATAY